MPTAEPPAHAKIALMKLGIVTFSDGRKRAADLVEAQCREFQHALANHVRGKGHKVVEAEAIVWNHETARREAERMNQAEVDAVLFNFCVWSFPDLAAQVARDVEAPICFVGNINPAFPGWVAFFASAGSLEEIGVPFGRVLGDYKQKSVARALDRWLAEHGQNRRERGYEAAERLKGLRYGEFDGPSMGMYTGHIDPSQWMEQFGIHVYHRSQLTLAWLSEKVDEKRVEAGLKWMEKHCGKIHWGERLEKGVDGHLGRQLRLYLATKDFCVEEGIDFLGLTGQLDYTEWEKGITMDVPEALLNDVADWEDAEKPVKICATECDSNGALTMQILHHLSETPVLFADLRHYFAEDDVYDLVNSGQHAPWFATGTDDVAANWKQVSLHPSNPMYMPCGGASVEFFAAPQDKMTFARLTRRAGKYRMHYFTGSFVRFGEAKDRALASQTSPEWPHAFAKFDCERAALASEYCSNHIHAIPGDWMGELRAVCEATGVEACPLS